MRKGEMEGKNSPRDVKHAFRGSTIGAPSTAIFMMLLVIDYRCINLYLGN